MTKSEFEQKFDSAYHSELIKISNHTHFKKMLMQYTEEHGKISIEGLAQFAFMESLTFNRQFLHRILTDIIEFDDE